MVIAKLVQRKDRNLRYV